MTLSCPDCGPESPRRVLGTEFSDLDDRYWVGTVEIVEESNTGTRRVSK